MQKCAKMYYFQVKVEWTQQLVATQKQRTERIRKETENMKAVLDAERSRQVEAIKTSQHIEQEEGRANVTRIKNEVKLKNFFSILHTDVIQIPCALNWYN